MPEPSTDELAFFGLSKDDYDETVIDVWPDIWPSFVVFRAAYTQWRVGINGVTGLDYNVLPWLMRVYATEDEVTAISDIQIMEATVLNIFHQSQSVNH